MGRKIVPKRRFFLGNSITIKFGNFANYINRGNLNRPKDPARTKNTTRSKFTTRSIFSTAGGDLLSRRTLCGHHFPGNYRHFSSQRRVDGVLNLGGIVKTLRRSNSLFLLSS